MEVLQRMFVSEEHRRNAPLPKILYLQMDNCARENKNTALAAYLAWLIERGVFERIHVSYLPVGHTHNECDQLGSRLAVGVRWNGINTLEDFLEVLRGCVHPPPNVEVLDSVADVVGMLNPKRSTRWSGSRVHFFEGIMALEEMLPEGEKVPDGVSRRHTTTLHFLITRVLNAAGVMVPGVRTKPRFDKELWSEPFIPFKDCPSGLSLQNIPSMRRKPVLDLRLREIESGLLQCSFRISPAEHSANLVELAHLQDTGDRPFHWADGGRLRREDMFRARASGSNADAEAEELSLVMPEESVITTVHTMRVRRKRKHKGLAAPSTTILIGNFVAFFCLPDPTSAIKRHFGIGSVVRINKADSTIVIKWWNSTSKKPFKGWRSWCGKGKNQEVAHADVIVCRSDNAFWHGASTTRGRTIARHSRDTIQRGVRTSRRNLR
jgi:hypothetical protein